ncbi:hypothetical protein M404DRAFT_991768 [Pisolithus tinctorius Marx 270]|uniref:Uncharacterized protein n=1 Tax=Pisolithus tinctorius Marx 270 TaxID=870435 RepID=A0A0C3KZW6_PISTI|nr:hypothetical protein M404DRAFT_991768 [Pisolithus tinctorius Marx 270]
MMKKLGSVTRGILDTAIDTKRLRGVQLPVGEPSQRITIMDGSAHDSEPIDPAPGKTWFLKDLPHLPCLRRRSTV